MAHSIIIKFSKSIFIHSERSLEGYYYICIMIIFVTLSMLKWVEWLVSTGVSFYLVLLPSRQAGGLHLIQPFCFKLCFYEWVPFLLPTTLQMVLHCIPLKQYKSSCHILNLIIYSQRHENLSTLSPCLPITF